MTPAVKFFEVSGSALAIAYALLIASNTGNETAGFLLLLISSTLFAGWALIDRRWAFLALQFFYAASAVLGMIRWGQVGAGSARLAAIRWAGRRSLREKPGTIVRRQLLGN